MNHKAIKQVLLIICIIVLFIVLIWQLQALLNGLLGTLALHILLRNTHTNLSLKKGWNASRAALFLLLMSFIVIMIPIIFITFNLLSSVNVVLKNYETILLTIHNYLDTIEVRTGIDILNIQNIKDITQKVAVYIPEIFNSTAGVITEVVMMYFTLYYTLIEKEKIELWVKNHLPFNKVNNLLLLEELEKSTLSNMAGIPVIGVAQGIISLIAYLICGIDNALSWALMTGIASIIPIVGTTLIWLPIAAYLLIIGHIWQGTFLLLFGVLVITNIDNLLRMTLLKKIANTHPLITIFGVIIGLNCIGFMGIIFGPIMLNYFFILFDIYKKEYH